MNSQLVTDALFKIKQALHQTDGVILEIKPHDQYIVKFDGSGRRLSTRNRKFLQHFEPATMQVQPAPTGPFRQSLTLSQSQPCETQLAPPNLQLGLPSTSLDEGTPTL